MAHRLHTLKFLCLLLLFAPKSYGQSAGEFVENKGQWDGAFRYRAKVHRGTMVFLEDGALTYSMATARQEVHKHNYEKLPETVPAHAWKVRFLNAAQNAEIEATEPQKHYYNYFLGSDSSRWKSGLHPAAGVVYRNLYRGIDLHTAFKEEKFKYSFHLAAGSDPLAIQLQYEGTDGVYLSQKGALLVKTSLGDVTEEAPVAWQTTAAGGKKPLRCSYSLKDHTVGFSFPNGYDKSLPIVIDPTVVFATFSGATADSWGFTATYNDTGDFYAGGLVNVEAGESYPTTTGAFQATYGNGNPNTGMSSLYSKYPCDINISKFNATGNTLLFGTYIGGSNNEQPHSMVVDSSGNLIIAGRTYSSNYPVTAGSFDNTFNGVADIVVTKLNASGTALLGSTFIGGSGADGVNVHTIFGPGDAPNATSSLLFNYGDDARSEVIVDRRGNVYVAANSQSTDFPVQNASQSTLSGTQDAVVFKLDNNLSSLLWSTYFGGSNDDAAYVLTFDTAQQNLYVGGGTTSPDFPMPPGGFQGTYQGGRTDGFVLHFGNSGTYPLLNGSFIGQNDYDQVYGLQTDYDDKIYLMGQTLGGSFPVSANVYSNGGSTQFLMKMDLALSSNLVSTVIGNGPATGPNISPVAFLVDTCGNVYLSGWGGQLFGENPLGASMTNMPITPGAIQPTTDGADFYFIALSKNFGSLLYGTYRGAVGADEHVDGGTSRFDRNGVVYQAICAGCGRLSFPTTTGAYSTTNRSARNCNLAALKIDFELGSVDARAGVTPTNRGCPPLDVAFTNTSINAATSTWDFGDGSPTDTARAPQHTYTRPGTYQAQLVAFNPVACRLRDTAYVTIIVDSNAISGSIKVDTPKPCPPFLVNITNNVTTPGNASFSWDFGDGNTSGARDPLTHQYADTGTYTIRLIVTDGGACNSPDTFTQTTQLRDLQVSGSFNSPDSLCVGAGGVLFQSSSTNATSLLWTFGDGDTSSQIAPVHVYAAPGKYPVVLVAANPDACNKTDTARKNITILTLPTARFDYTPIELVPNTPIDFINQSVNANRYRWAFGDGDFSSVENPSHLYKSSSSFVVCLTAASAEGCLDTVCREVLADVRIACDVPSAFSPNGDGVNDILYVRGAFITSFVFKLYNRWGQLLFETSDLQKGWDGIWNGKPQEADAYAFTLTAFFGDGSTFTKKGNITLLR